MKNVTKIVIMALCAALALSSCKKNRYTPEEEDQFVPLGFTAVSQAMVKAGTAKFPYDDFGVWGIARRPGVSNPYILWSQNSMLSVTKGADDQYIPSSAAYWAVGYTYDFIAVAPWSKAQNTTSVVTGNASGTDRLTFACDIADQINAGNYTFDLLGAAVEREVTSRPNEPQELTFWHLFSWIRISATFDECDGGSISKYVLKNVDTQASYTISFDANGDLVVACSSNGESGQMNLEKSAATVDFYLIPQDMSDIELYVDFNLTIDGRSLSAENVMIDVNKVLEGQTYEYNQRYNWNLKITPKFITFDSAITVEEWDKVEGGSNPNIPL